MALYLSALDFLSYEFCDIFNIYGILRVRYDKEIYVDKITLS
jgi:hypothetical protein